MFKESGAIEAVQAVSITRKVSWNPIDDNTNTMLVAIIDKYHKVFWGSVATCNGEIAGGLITPGACEGVFRNR